MIGGQWLVAFVPSSFSLHPSAFPCACLVAQRLALDNRLISDFGSPDADTDQLKLFQGSNVPLFRFECLVGAVLLRTHFDTLEDEQISS